MAWHEHFMVRVKVVQLDGMAIWQRSVGSTSVFIYLYIYFRFWIVN